MDRWGALKSGWRAVGVTGLALVMVAAPAIAAAQQAAAPAAQEDILKFSAASPAIILIQIHADKTADFESAWGAIKAALAKSDNADIKGFGETLAKLSRVDQPAIDTPAGKAAIYVLQLDAPSTAISYNPVKVVYETLWKNGQEGAILTRAEADAIYEKLKASFQNINPPWKLVRVQ